MAGTHFSSDNNDNNSARRSSGRRFASESAPQNPPRNNSNDKKISDGRPFEQRKREEYQARDPQFSSSEDRRPQGATGVVSLRQGVKDAPRGKDPKDTIKEMNPKIIGLLIAAAILVVVVLLLIFRSISGSITEVSAVESFTDAPAAVETEVVTQSSDPELANVLATSDDAVQTALMLKTDEAGVLNAIYIAIYNEEQNVSKVYSLPLDTQQWVSGVYSGVNANSLDAGFAQEVQAVSSVLAMSFNHAVLIDDEAWGDLESVLAASDDVDAMRSLGTDADTDMSYTQLRGLVNSLVASGSLDGDIPSVATETATSEDGSTGTDVLTGQWATTVSELKSQMG